MNNGLRYYLIICSAGIIIAFFSILLVFLYSRLWDFIQIHMSESIVLLFVFPFLAISIPYVLVRFLADKKKTGSSTHVVLEAYHLSNGEVSLRDTLVKPAAAVLTLGLGGSAGPEGPNLLLGSGIASALSRFFKVQSNLKQRIFIAGAAAGLAATFRTPLTAILFALEIPYKGDLDRRSLMDALIASIPAYLISVFFLGDEVIFSPIGTVQITGYEVALTLILGVICGLYSVFFTKLFSFAENFTIKLRKKIGNLGLIALGTIILGVSGSISIYSIGVGMHFVNELVVGAPFSITFLLAIILLKTLTTIVTMNFGGIGGLFFPTIIIGAGIGYVFSFATGSEFQLMFIAVGMAALLSGTHKVLLTSTAFVIETLGGIFVIPSLIATGVSYFISGKHSFYPLQPVTRQRTEELAIERFLAKAKMLIPEKLKKVTAKDFMTKNPISLHEGITVAEALMILDQNKRRVLPVIDEDSHVIGTVSLENLACSNVCNDNIVCDTLIQTALIVHGEARLESIAELMREKQVTHVFVVDDDEKLIGVIARIDLADELIELLAE